jgi:type IV pilus assembly protein PilB
MAQRLVRVICTECKQVDEDPDPKIMRMLGFTPEELHGGTVYKGKGCNSCNGTGYRGRIGIFEMMEMTHALQELAMKSSSLGELRQAARATGMKNLLEDGRRKIFNGITTPDELVRTTQVSELIAE